MTNFVPFPRIPHLALLDSLDVRDDKVLTPDAARSFLEVPIVVEEKIDGENLGLSVVDGKLLAQSRSSYVEPGGMTFRGLSGWLRPRSSRIVGELGEDLVLYGEWCAVRHSVSYAALPDWLLVFDVFDRRASGFWSLDERDLLAESLNLATVPKLGDGSFALADLTRMLGASTFGEAPMEGLVLRQAARPGSRAKLVRPEFIRSVHEHWRSRRPEPNRLAVTSLRDGRRA